MTKNELSIILAKHEKWLRGEPGGMRANLVDADLNGADLRRAYLRGANLVGANLSDANLFGAELSDANLFGAYLSDAYLNRADLRGANLNRADLRGANLVGANLSEANLNRADLRGANLVGANLDYAAWPLWCGSLNVTIDTRIAAQLAYHLLAIWPESRTPGFDMLALANQFHRIGTDVDELPLQT